MPPKASTAQPTLSSRPSLGSPLSRPTANAYKRAYVGGKFALEVGGETAGWLFSFEGGMAVGEIVPEKIGSDHLVHKHISGIKYDDITVSCGPAMSRGFYQWITNSFQHNGRHSRKHGALIGADFNLAEMSRLSFYDALITELGFPACDAASHDGAKLSVKMAPEHTRFEQRSSPGPSIAGHYPIDSKRAKMWLMRNFRVSIDGIDCSRVNKVEAITLKQKTAEVPLGETREVAREPAVIEYPNVVLSIPESHSEGFVRWYDDFVIGGRCSMNEERGGSIEFLSEDMSTVVASIDLMHLGLFKLTPDKAESGTERIRQVRVEMYCEQMKIKLLQTFA